MGINKGIREVHLTKFLCPTSNSISSLLISSVAVFRVSSSTCRKDEVEIFRIRGQFYFHSTLTRWPSGLVNF